MRSLLGHVGFEPAPLLVRVSQFVEGVGEFDAAAIELEPLRDARIVRLSRASAASLAG